MKRPFAWLALSTCLSACTTDAGAGNPYSRPDSGQDLRDGDGDSYGDGDGDGDSDGDGDGDGDGDAALGGDGDTDFDAGSDRDGGADRDGGGDGGRDAGGDGGTPPDCKDGKVVHFVYFVEADETYSASQRDDVERQAFRFQKYWHEQLGVTFYLNYPVVDVIEADHEADWYLTTADGIHNDERWYRLGNVKKEVYKKLGITDFDPDHRVVNYPTSRHDGRVGGNFGGAWMDGDDLTCIANNGFNYPYGQNDSAHCVGHVAHEFGHVLGLDHEGPNDDCMQYGFYTDDPNDLCSFSPANTAKIRADSDNAGWFEAMPGETCVGR